MLDIHYKRRPEALLNMTPIIDIVFLLLLFFLLTTNFIAQEGIKVNLPQAAGATAPQTREDITIYVTREGDIFLRDKKVSEEALFKDLSALIGDDQERLVTIKADRRVILNRVVKVMDIAKSSGAGRLCIATEKDF